MNSADLCHEVQGCPGLFIDAFRGHFLRKMQDPDNVFVLTHYHGDHYQNLPREEKYNGLALIHCTPVTAALLIQVHQVPAQWVVEHEYEQTFAYTIRGQSGKQAHLTFYDANHCPGACIVLIRLPDGICHLHTGDMRYHETFQSYPLLRDAVDHQKLDIVYLDTTYSHPKHDFVPQEEAIQSIADTTVELLGGVGSGPETKAKTKMLRNDVTTTTHMSAPNAGTKTLILLSCYSIGKEKVLWEVSTRTNQLVYVSEKKFKMLQCVGQGNESLAQAIVHRCTLDPESTPIHVIPMGLAGELWPFFRPNFLKCAAYARKLPQEYDKVVAFLPTGWAHGSKWNREHAISTKTIPAVADDDGGRHHGPIEVQVRLIPYSEHSAFTELVSFVKFLKPRKVIPTVFSDASDYRNIEHRFRNMLDTKRAKQAFFRSMVAATTKQQQSSSSTSAEKNPRKTSGTKIASSCKNESFAADRFGQKDQPIEPCMEAVHGRDRDGDDDDSSIEVLKVEPPESKPTITIPASTSVASTSKKNPGADLSTLLAMGFSAQLSQKVLDECGGNVERAVDKLLNGCFNPTPNTFNVTEVPSSSAEASPSTCSIHVAKRKRTSPEIASSATSATAITNFFSPKKNARSPTT